MHWQSINILLLIIIISNIIISRILVEYIFMNCLQWLDLCFNNSNNKQYNIGRMSVHLFICLFSLPFYLSTFFHPWRRVRGVRGGERPSFAHLCGRRSATAHYHLGERWHCTYRHHRRIHNPAHRRAAHRLCTGQSPYLQTACIQNVYILWQFSEASLYVYSLKILGVTRVLPPTQLGRTVVPLVCPSTHIQPSLNSWGMWLSTRESASFWPVESPAFLHQRSRGRSTTISSLV